MSIAMDIRIVLHLVFLNILRVWIDGGDRMTDLPVTHNNIINFLNNRKEYTSAKTIAKEFQVSTKTVYRKINEINQQAGKEVIHSAKGKGFRVLKNSVLAAPKIVNEKADSSPFQRRNSVLLKLLFNSPNYLDLSLLYQGFFVSSATQENDLNELKKLIKKYGLTIKHLGNKIAILGQEKVIRKAIIKLLQTNPDTEIRIPIKNISPYDARFINEQLKFIEEGIDAKLAYPYNINIFSHLYILIMRARFKQQLQVNATDDEKIANEDTKQYASLYRIAGIVIENTSQYIVKRLPNYEVDYLFQYLISSRLTPLKKHSKLYIHYSKKVQLFTEELIKRVDQQLNLKIDFEKLKFDLIRHIGPMINRLKNNISVENSLLDEIKLEYTTLFKEIRSVMVELCNQFKIASVSQNEIGFITLYFAKYLEQQHRHYHVWVVCTSGVGTSELLKVKLENNFQNIKVDKIVSSFDDALNNIEKHQVDLIISTVILPDTVSADYVLVSALLNEHDKEVINGALQKIK